MVSTIPPSDVGFTRASKPSTTIGRRSSTQDSVKSTVVVVSAEVATGDGSEPPEQPDGARTRTRTRRAARAQAFIGTRIPQTPGHRPPPAPRSHRQRLARPSSTSSQICAAPRLLVAHRWPLCGRVPPYVKGRKKRGERESERAPTGAVAGPRRHRLGEAQERRHRLLADLAGPTPCLGRLATHA